MCPKLSCPPDFGGECHNGHAFLNSCSLYICLALEQFHDEEERVLWALTFFKSGRAAKWSENMFRQEVDAINALEGTSYHQGGRTVDDYLDNFQALVSDAGYMNPRTPVVKFWQGLRLEIQNQIATMPYGRPADTDPDAWYRAARRIDQARLANEAFQSVSRSAPSTPPKTVFARPSSLSVARLSPVPPLPVTLKPLPPAPSMGTSMDVNTTRKTRSLPPQGCYRCGDANYLVRDCPYRMDVRQLTAEQ